MKHLLFLFAFSFYTTIAFGQITKGNWLVGGNFDLYQNTENYNSSTLKIDSKHTVINVSANIGYFVMDRLAFGLKPTFSSIKGEGINGSGSSTNFQIYRLGPFGRYYFLDTKKQYNILIDMSYQLGVLVIERKKIESKQRNLSLLVGPVIYFNSSVGLEFLMGYNNIINNLDGTESTSKRFQIVIGFQIHLIK